MKNNEIIKLFLRRLGEFKDNVVELDYPRIEELCFLIRQTILIDIKEKENKKNEKTPDNK